MNHRPGVIRAAGAIGALVLVTACFRPQGFGPAERAAVAAAADSATRAFEAAQRSRDAEAAIALLAPDFYMYSDGVRMGFDSVTASIRRSLSSLRYLEPGFSALAVHPLSPQAAIATFAFRDSLVTDAGVSQRFTGATTLVWERREGRWLITYAHADHHPVP